MRPVIHTMSITVPRLNCLDMSDLKYYLKEIATAAGGYTITDAEGGWIMANGDLEHEGVWVVKVGVFTETARVEVVSTLENLIMAMLTRGKQEAVFANLSEGDAVYTEDDLS